jgi:hypothetical protein
MKKKLDWFVSMDNHRTDEGISRRFNFDWNVLVEPINYNLGITASLLLLYCACFDFQ